MSSVFRLLKPFTERHGDVKIWKKFVQFMNFFIKRNRSIWFVPQTVKNQFLQITTLRYRPFFFKSEVSQAARATDFRYREMINIFWWPKLRVWTISFTSSVIKCHPNNETISPLRNIHSGWVSPHGGRVIRLLRSCDWI